MPDLGQCTDDTFRVVPAVFHCLCRRMTLGEAQDSVRSGRRGACHSVSMTSRLFLYDKGIWLSGPCHRELLASFTCPFPRLADGMKTAVFTKRELNVPPLCLPLPPGTMNSIIRIYVRYGRLSIFQKQHAPRFRQR